MIELESEFLTATNENKVVIVLDKVCRNVNVGKTIKKLWTNDLTHFNPLSHYAWCYMGL